MTVIKHFRAGPSRGGAPSIDRRTVLVRGGLTAGVVATFPAPAIAQDIRELKLVTSWPKGLPGLGTSAERMGQSITAASGKRLSGQGIRRRRNGQCVRGFDAVSAGVADMYHSAEYYWEAKSPGFSFFAAVPFGFTADEMAAWIHSAAGRPFGTS